MSCGYGRRSSCCGSSKLQGLLGRERTQGHWGSRTMNLNVADSPAWAEAPLLVPL
jgi:hypothetical protein